MEKKETKFYTGQGDKGLTALTPSAQVSKADERVVAVGSVEEIVSALGVVRTVTSCPIFRGKLERIQKTLRTLSHGLRDPRSGKFVFSAEEIEFLESDMDKMLEKVSVETVSDALPGGNTQSAYLDLAHTTARRAERDMIAMDRRYAVPATFKQYINRLSDYLLIAARYSDYLHNKAEAEKAASPSSSVPVVNYGAPAAPATAVPASSTDALVAEVLARLGGAKVLDLDRAKRLIEAVELRAKEQGKHAVIAVSNAEGNPIAVHVMDGAFLVSYEVAVKKAYTAVAVKMSTMELSALCQPGGTFYGLQALDKVITFGGGIPLYQDGVIVGGLGVSGGTGEEDHDLALYGVAVFRTL
ncbi:MAG: cob(I)yrinic acid a,c-diamide adenosyltransferase [Clostridia bacterium]|nr:cob(I)yrinic acid a,c-diamide adenosyltransferase [Clostridia bacterium]